MPARATYLVIAFCWLTAGICAQSGNPFDLQWKRTSAHRIADPSLDSSAAEAVSETTESPEPPAPVTPPPAPVTVEPAADRETAPDTALTHASSENPFELRSGTSPPTRKDDNPDALKPLPDEPASENVVTPPAETTPSPPIEKPVTGQDTRDVVSNLVLFLLFGLVLLLLTWAVNINRGFLRKIYRAVLNENFSSLLLREQRFASNQYLYYLVYVTFFINAGLFLYFLSHYTHWAGHFRHHPLMLFIAFATGVYLVRHLALAILGGTFPIGKEMKHFSFNILLFNILLGIFLIPVNLFLAFGPADLYGVVITIALIGAGVVYLARQFRGLVIAGGLIGSNLFHFFVYLCTVEVLPVLVLFKLLITD
ncbi:MAG: DUF4271 domain-containing protein [Saprospiraceae bacterium]|nr:DUF4271 domain-containing protein [Saprospiraceae bacterium]